MKKCTRIMLLLLGTVMLFFFSACQEKRAGEGTEPSSAIALWEKIDQTMNGLESMEMTSTTKLVYFDDGCRYLRTVSRYLLSAKDAHYTESRYITACPELSTVESFSTTEAYYDGKAYTAVYSGAYAQRLCSEMTHEEYDHAPVGALTEEFQIADCANAAFSKGENGLWELKFTGYGQAAIANALKDLGLQDEIEGTAVTDMVVTLTANADYYVQKMQIVLRFAPGENAPEFSIEAEYYGHQSAVFDVSRLNAQEYVTVDDVRILTAVMEGLKQRQNEASGQFELDMSRTYILQEEVSVSTESNIVEYAWKDGTYTYSIESVMDGEAVQIQYENGQRTVITDMGSYDLEQTDREAKAFVDGLIDAGRYNSAAVTNIQKTGDGIYVLQCEELDIQEFAPDYENEQVRLLGGSQQITVTFSGSSLMRIRSVITLRGTYNEEPMTMSMDALVVFDAVS